MQASNPKLRLATHAIHKPEGFGMIKRVSAELLALNLGLLAA